MFSFRWTRRQLVEFLASWLQEADIDVGSSVPYALAVQEGRPPHEPQKQKMPARPFIPKNSDEWVSEAVAVAVEQTCRAVLAKWVPMRRKKVAQIFGSAVIEETFARIHNGFRAKSAGGSDDLGNTWKKLADATVEKKRRRAAKEGRVKPLSQMQKRQWRMLHNRFIDMLARSGRYSKEEMRSIANARAWAYMKKGDLEQFGRPINVKTGRLERSLRPGRRAGTRYWPASNDQVATYKQ